MIDLIKTLKIVKKAFKVKPQKPKLTPKQFQQKAKVQVRIKKVISKTEGIDGLVDESSKFIIELVKTFVKQAPEKVNQANESLKATSSDFDGPGQSSDPKA